MSSERKFTMHQHEGNGGFYTGPNFSTHQEVADSAILPDSTVSPRPAIKSVRYLPGKEPSPYTRGMYTALLEESATKDPEETEKKEFNPRMRELLSHFADVLNTRYNFPVQIPGLSPREGARTVIDISFDTDEGIKKKAQEPKQQDYILSKLPPIVSTTYAPLHRVHVVGSSEQSVPTVSFSHDRFQKPLAKTKISDEDKFEMSKTAAEFIRYLTRSSINVLPERFSVEGVPPTALNLLLASRTGVISAFLNQLNDKTGSAFSKEIQSLGEEIFEGVSEKPDSRRRNPRTVFHGVSATVFLQDLEADGVEKVLATTGSGAHQAIVDFLSINIMEEFFRSVSQNPALTSWFIPPEKWGAELKRKFRGKTPSKRDQGFINNVQQWEQEHTRAIQALTKSAEAGADILKSVSFPSDLGTEQLETPEEREVFSFYAFRGGTLASLMYGIPLTDTKRLADTVRKQHGVSDSLYGTPDSN